MVENLVIVEPFRGAVYGLDVRDVTVRGNDVSGHNSGCVVGFHIQPFTAPTTVPGVSAPVSGGLYNGWAGIMFDARAVEGTVRAERNYLHDAHCGDGIDVRVHGTARVRADITSNLIERLEEGEGFDSILAIGLQTLDSGRLVSFQDRNRVNDIGNGPPTPEGADSEGAFANLDDSSQMDVTIDHFTYTNPRGVGGWSANGMELVTTGGSPRANMVMRNSTLSGSPGDILEEGNLGRGSKMSLTLDNVVATRSTGLGNVQVIPFNNGDCLVGGNGDAGNELRLRIVDSELTNCVNNGVSILNADKPGSTIDVEIERSRITGNRGINLWLRNVGGLDKLALKVQDSALCNSQGTNIQLEDDRGTLPPGSIDLGGGALGSAGRNDFSGGMQQARIQNFEVAARNNWWGSPGGPATGRALVVGGTLDYEPALAGKPALSC